MLGVYQSERIRWQENRVASPSTLNDDTSVLQFVGDNSRTISWSRGLRGHLRSQRDLAYDSSAVRTSTYRPFTKQRLYFDRQLNEVQPRLMTAFPSEGHVNHGFYYVGMSSAVPFLRVDDRFNS
jgi:predicted helicase